MKKNQYLHPPLFPVGSNWKPTNVASLPCWSTAKRISIDVETCDPGLKDFGIGVRRDGYIVGISFSIEDGPTAYLPIRHAGGDNLEENQVLTYFRENAKIFNGDIVGANLSYDLDYLWQEGIFFNNVRFYRDIQIADPLIYELHQSYSLQSIASRYGFSGKDEVLLKKAAEEYKVDPKSGLWKLPARYVGAYAEADTQQPLLIIRKQERILDEEDLWDIYNLESRVLPVLVKMRRRGVRINESKLDEIQKWAFEQEKLALNIVYDHTSHKIVLGDVWRAESLFPALSYIGLNPEKTNTGKFSIQNELLNSFKHPVTDALIHARKVNKLRTTFVESIKRHMVLGRIHCTFNQIARETENGDQKGARFGRISATHPNLQQQPSRDEFAKMWRSIYIPEEGTLWASCDYSQQEPRWITHFASILNLPKARTMAQAYHSNPRLDSYTFMADLANRPRATAKTCVLGLGYGEGGAKLCKSLGLPTRWNFSYRTQKGNYQIFFDTKQEALDKRKELGSGFIFEDAGEEGRTLIDAFNNSVPFVKDLSLKYKLDATRNGQIKTICGRKLNFIQKEDGCYEGTHRALNRLIQGSAADQTKSALIELDSSGYFLQLQIHDEIVCSVKNKKEALEISNIMENTIKAEVPFVVDIELGPSWGESI